MTLSFIYDIKLPRRLNLSTAKNQQMVQRVNELDQPIGTVRRSDVFSPGVAFRVAHVLVFNRSGDLLMQRLAPGHGRNPHKWGSSVAAYVLENESYFDAAMRRMMQEIGVSVPLEVLGTIRMSDRGATKFIAVYCAVSDSAQLVDTEDIENLEYRHFEDVVDELKDSPSKFTETFSYVYNVFVAADRPGGWPDRQK